MADEMKIADLGTRMGMVFSAYSIGTFVGPVVGGYVYELGPSIPFYTIGALGLIDAIFRLLVQDRPSSKSQDEVASPNILKNKELIKLLFAIAAAGMMIGEVEVVLTLQLESYYSLTSGQIGLCFLAFVLPEIVASPVGGYVYDKYGLKFCAFPSLTVTITMLCLYAIPKMPLWSLLFLTAFNGFATACYLIPMLPEVMKCTHSNNYGTAYGLVNAFFAIGLLVGAPLSSFLFATIGFSWTCVILGLSLAILTFPAILMYNSPPKDPEEASSSALDLVVLGDEGRIDSIDA